MDDYIKKITGNVQSWTAQFKLKIFKAKYNKVSYKKIGMHIYYEKPSNIICVILHGMGGDKNSPTLLSLVEKLVESDINVLTFDAPGIGDSIDSEKFWGSNENDNGNMNSIIEYIISLNKYKKIFAVGFSGGANYILAYLIGGEKINNYLKSKIDYSFFVSPAFLQEEVLNNINNNTFISKNKLSLSHTYDLVKHRLYHKKYKEIPKILAKCTFNVIEANKYGSGECNILYKFPEKNIKINGVAIYAEDDTIIKKEFVEGIKKYCDLIVLPTGGHMGFFNPDGTREHENIIIKKIKHLI